MLDVLTSKWFLVLSEMPDVIIHNESDDGVVRSDDDDFRSVAEPTKTALKPRRQISEKRSAEETTVKEYIQARQGKRKRETTPKSGKTRKAKKTVKGVFINFTYKGCDLFDLWY